MAEVYEVVSEKTGAHYALKVFAGPTDDGHLALNRFFAEARLLARLRHPRIVHVVDFGTDAATDRAYYLMDIILDAEGEPCTLDQAPATTEDIARWYEDLREALAYLHAKGIVHRDLKPQNVFLGPDGHVVLADLGVAKILDAALRESVALQLTMVADGVRDVKGTPGFMPPEVVNFGQYSESGDYWALGVTIYQLLTHDVYDSRTSIADLEEEMDGYGPEWARIVPKLLHEQPTGRAALAFDDVLGAVKELDEQKAAQDYEAVVAAKKAVEVKSRRAVRMAYGMAALSLVLLLGVVPVGVFMVNGSESRLVAKEKELIDKTNNWKARETAMSADLAKIEVRLTAKEKELIDKTNNWKDRENTMSADLAKFEVSLAAKEKELIDKTSDWEKQKTAMTADLAKVKSRVQDLEDYSFARLCPKIKPNRLRKYFSNDEYELARYDAWYETESILQKLGDGISSASSVAAELEGLAQDIVDNGIDNPVGDEDLACRLIYNMAGNLYDRVGEMEKANECYVSVTNDLSEISGNPK
ncbi:MAG: protein kinase [Kiritimatiellae bacterium]|nr:protein kinase [Kiritimatiellia bacterium]